MRRLINYQVDENVSFNFNIYVEKCLEIGLYIAHKNIHNERALTCCVRLLNERDRTVPHEQRLVKTGNGSAAEQQRTKKFHRKTLIDCMRQTQVLFFCLWVRVWMCIQQLCYTFFCCSRHLASLSVRDNDQFVFGVECCGNALY